MLSIFAELGPVFMRLIILFAAALIVVRLMGNRTVGQLSPFDFVIMVGIGDIIIAGALDNAPTIVTGVEALAILLVLQQIIGYLALKSPLLRTWFEGMPVTLIENGNIIRDNFVKTQFNYDDLRQELHRKGLDITRLADIKLARIESCGEFSIIKNPETEPLTKRDFEAYIKDIYDNPLSIPGEKWAQFEQFIEEVHSLAEYVKSMQPGRETNSLSVCRRDHLNKDTLSGLKNEDNDASIH